MNNSTVKRIGVLLFAGMLLLMGAWRPALADGEAAPLEQAYLYGGEIVDLGDIPEETLVEQGCDILLVADTNTGVLLHEKNISVQMPVNGIAVQLMTALVALDYLQPDELLTVTAEQMAMMPEEGVRFGLMERSKASVSDLLASMLLTGAADSAYVIADVALKKSGAESIGVLMAEKAVTLGMTSTDYTLSDGLGTADVLTTAMDQSRLYLTAVHNDALQKLLKSGTYAVQSKAIFATPTPTLTPVPTPTPNPALTPTPTATPSPAPTFTPTPRSVKTPKPTREPKVTPTPKLVADPNQNLPAEISSGITAVVPDNANYDVRLGAAVQSFVKYAKKDYGVAFYRAVDYRSDYIYLYWSQNNARRILPETMTSLVEVFSRRKVVDLVPYMQALTNNLNVEKNGVSISGWSVPSDYRLYGRQMAFYEPDDPKQQAKASAYDLSKMSVRLQPDPNTMVLNADGSRTLRATVLVNNMVADTVQLSTASKVSSVDPSQQSAAGLYTDDDVMPAQPTLMSQYGWIVLIAGVALLAMIVIIIGVLIRNRMER